MIYLSSPFSHPLPAVRERRWEAACRATAALLKQGKLVFSPIVHSYEMKRFGCPNTHEFWMPLDIKYLVLCREVLVLTIEGWETSRGVMEEMQAAKKFNKRICYAGPESDWFDGSSFKETPP